MTITHEYRSKNNTPSVYLAPSSDNGVALQQTGHALTDANAADTVIVDANGDPITNFGAPTTATSFATIAVSALGVTNLVAAQATKSIRVLQFVIVSNGAVNIKFQSHVTPTDLTGLFYLIANTGVSSGFSPVGHFQTAAGEALDINLSQAIAVGGYLTYTLI
jgi:hypothetical protein